LQKFIKQQNPTIKQQPMNNEIPQLTRSQKLRIRDEQQLMKFLGDALIPSPGHRLSLVKLFDAYLSHTRKSGAVFIGFWSPHAIARFLPKHGYTCKKTSKGRVLLNFELL